MKDSSGFFIDTLFPNYVAREKLDLDLQKFVAYAYQMKSESSGRRVSNSGGWQSDHIDPDTAELSELSEAIKKLTLKIDSHYGMNEIYRLNSFWLNINGNCDYNIPHIHSGTAMSGVFYIQTPKDCGDIVFLNANKAIGEFECAFKNFNRHTRAWTAYLAKQNYLYMFSPWLEHYVQPNKSMEDRISIAFNVSIVGCPNDRR